VPRYEILTFLSGHVGVKSGVRRSASRLAIVEAVEGDFKDLRAGIDYRKLPSTTRSELTRKATPTSPANPEPS
jgi:hypothetical protein